MSNVQSVERAFAVLRCLAGGPAGVSEIAERVNLPKSTVSRLLSTLQRLDAVEQLSIGGEYRVSTLLVELASGIHPGANLVEIAHPHLSELVGATGEAAGLSVLDGGHVHYLDQVAADGVVQVRDWTGERIPAHVVSSGLVLLAAAGDAERDRFLAQPLAAFTERSITDPAAVRARLADIAARGSAWVYEEYSLELNSVAATVRNGAGRAVAAIHVHGPSYRFPGATPADEIADLVTTVAGRISARLAASTTADRA